MTEWNKRALFSKAERDIQALNRARQNKQNKEDVVRIMAEKGFHYDGRRIKS